VELRTPWNGRGEIIHALASDKEDDVTAHAILFVDHAESKSRELTIEVREDVRDGRSRGIDVGAPGRVPAELTRHDNARHLRCDANSRDERFE
jgi:hypothetical protein